jgi:hypothetical protein
MAQTLEIADFSGGVTDYYLYAPPNKMRHCDNLLINQYPEQGKPVTRPGSELYNSTYPRVSTNNRINTCFKYKGVLFVQSGNTLYYYSQSTGWTIVLGPTGNPAFISADYATQFTYSNWNYHTIITYDKLAGAGASNNYPKKIIINTVGVPEVMEAGLPSISIAGVTLTPSHAGAQKSYLYKIVYRQNYTVFGPITFEDNGTPSASKQVTTQDVLGISGHSITLNSIPVLSNGATSNFRTGAIYVDVYRTGESGTVFFYVGSVLNGTTTYVDTLPDTTLFTRNQLYTEGGVVSNDRPPKCKVAHIKSDIGYYGNVETSTNERINYRLQQSVAGDIDSCPESFYVDLDDEIVSISSTKSNVVVLCKNSIYRIDGEFDELGRGGMLAERISDTAGCVSAQSPVQAMDGVFWLGFDGAYFTDGFRVVKLNEDFDKTYKTYMTNGGVPDETRMSRVQGKYDKRKNRVWWTIQGEGSDEVDRCYVLDLNWGIKQNATFTTVSGTSFAPSALEFENGNLIRCDKRGYVLIHRDSIYTDPVINTLVAPASWNRETIIYNLESIAFDFGTSATRKFVIQANVTAESTTNLSLQIISNNDDNKRISNLLPIRYRGNITWGEPDIYWGESGLPWNQQGLIHEKRLMPAQNLRCNVKSLRFTNATVAIVNSDRIGTADIDQVAKTVTLNQAGTYDWPTNSLGYFIAFELDNFTEEFEIVTRTDNVLTFSDILNHSRTNVGQKWIIRGKPKGEVLNLINYSIVYEASGPTLHPFRTGESGEVGT